MVNLLEAHNELAKKYANTVDKAGFQYIDNAMKIIKERGDDPADYELAMVSKKHVDDPFTIEWSLRIRKIGTPGLVD